MTDDAGGRPGFLGHPRGLAYLAFTELWERFSYYGMTALLALYLVKQLLLPGHEDNVLGLDGLRSFLEFRGPMSDQAFASLIYGWYGGLVYFTPIMGGWIADRLFGTKATVVLGALMMSAGHLLMTFDASFLIALAFLILGSGCLKGNISAQVGQLYPADDESMRTRGYTIFSAAINVGSVLGPLASGAVAALYGWHAGFGVAAALMLVALVVYLVGQRHLPGKRPAKTGHGPLPPLTRLERQRTIALIICIALLILPALAYSMIWNVGIVFVDAQVDLSTPLGAVPAAWFNSVDSFASIIAVPPLIALWAWQARRRREPDSVTKMAIGAAITGASALVLALGCLLAGPDGKVSVAWALACYFGMGVGFLYYWPVMLALVSQTAPAKINATLMGGAFLALFAGTVLMGWVGSFYEEMSNAKFWLLDGSIGLAGALLIFLLHNWLVRRLQTA
ncbi:MAG TPA: peptide MFS transporter [Sphingomicrobium sp.]|nr:peptide MFS transporter [Sphingomicrobium sp.]